MCSEKEQNEAMQKQIAEVAQYLEDIESRGWYVRIKCKLGLHKVVRSGWAKFDFIERCKCEAVQMNHSGWFMPRGYGRR